MNNLEENLLESFINLKGLLSQKVEQQSKIRLSNLCKDDGSFSCV